MTLIYDVKNWLDNEVDIAELLLARYACCYVKWSSVR
jgi:hypothetical protein